MKNRKLKGLFFIAFVLQNENLLSLEREAYPVPKAAKWTQTSQRKGGEPGTKLTWDVVKSGSDWSVKAVLHDKLYIVGESNGVPYGVIPPSTFSIDEPFILSYKMMERHLARKEGGIAEVKKAPLPNQAWISVQFDTMKGSPRSIVIFEPVAKTEILFEISNFEMLEPKRADAMIQEWLVAIPVWKKPK